jgi:hypothetical protein
MISGCHKSILVCTRLQTNPPRNTVVSIQCAVQSAAKRAPRANPTIEQRDAAISAFGDLSPHAALAIDQATTFTFNHP